MAKYASMVEESTTTSGTSDITLGGATSGHRTLAAAFSANDWVNYLIKDADGSAWERGYGKFNGTTGLTRDYVRESSNSDAKITLSAGTHTVTIAAHPEMAEFRGYVLSIGTTYTVPDATVEPAEWSTEEEDTDGIITVPITAHLPVPEWVDRVRVEAYVGFAGSATGSRIMYLKGADGSVYPGMPQANEDGRSAGNRLHFASGPVAPVLSGSDYGVRIDLYQSSGGALNCYNYGWVSVEFVQ